MPSFKLADIPDLTGRIVIVTGGNAGLGEASCLELARKGAKVYMVARTKSKAEEAMKKIKQAIPSADIHYLHLDLTDLTIVRKAAEEFLSKEKRLDILLNNAGIMAKPYSFTKDGLEVQVGTNVVGHYLFSLLLLPTLYNTSKLPEYAEPDSPTVRIVQLSSVGYLISPRDTSFRDLEEMNKQYWPEAKGTWERYAKSKLGNIIIANELIKILPKDARISNLSVQPGIVRTRLTQGALESYGVLGKLASTLVSPLMTPAKDGILTQLYACTSTEVDKLGLNGSLLSPAGWICWKSSLAKDKDGRLGSELARFCYKFFKEKLDIDMVAYLREAGLEVPSSHL